MKWIDYGTVIEGLEALVNNYLLKDLFLRFTIIGLNWPRLPLRDSISFSNALRIKIEAKVISHLRNLWLKSLQEEFLVIQSFQY